ncbi:NAD-dependent protein deacetylase sirtuin-3, mitochondrial isoform X1 [Haemorhous mexicanus]|uniref:NAD-dependent protein deacetylase sirtuin-3, mitochondrial isoform X1 n=1 Tax=Haemorhous mexicanus TaxID=30427 RepID=UPI0028BF0437|nr:NAD-dependent protein deacetylase sirtuin-3, mitochondrial isoform X1 [Haemorhous mexicanus]
MERGARALLAAAWRSLWERGPCHGGSAVRAARCGGDGKGLAGGRAGRIQGSRPFCVSAAARAILGRWGGDKGKEKITLKDVAELLRKKECRRVVVMAGAGISTPSGIPDFRSPGSGLYSNLEQYDIPYPEAIFELGYFFVNPKPFFTLAKELYPGNYRPNSAHYFLRLLHDKGLLLRLYTQNIDGLERVAGIPPDRLVEAHGTFATATCTVCQRNFPGEDFRGIRVPVTGSFGVSPFREMSWGTGSLAALCAPELSSLTSCSLASSSHSASSCTSQTSPWQTCSSSLGHPWRWSPLPAWPGPCAAPCRGCSSTGSWWAPSRGSSATTTWPSSGTWSAVLRSWWSCWAGTRRCKR